jgi:hypothetical protein
MSWRAIEESASCWRWVVTGFEIASITIVFPPPDGLISIVASIVITISFTFLGLDSIGFLIALTNGFLGGHSRGRLITLTLTSGFLGGNLRWWLITLTGRFLGRHPRRLLMSFSSGPLGRFPRSFLMSFSILSFGFVSGLFVVWFPVVITGIRE